jgi:hypothetical protein
MLVAGDWILVKSGKPVKGRDRKSYRKIGATLGGGWDASGRWVPRFCRGTLEGFLFEKVFPAKACPAD